MSESSKAVFISYASQDAGAAARICEALRAAEIEVWFDRSELRGGDAWDHKIRQQIRDCALFMPIVSANTVSRAEGYFRLEWGLADHRTGMIARNKAFIVPVCIDHTPDRGTDIPDSFLKVQWTRLPGGDTPVSFCERVKVLLADEGTSAAREQRGTTAVPDNAPPRPRERWMVLTAGAVFVALIGGWWVWRMGRSGPVTAPGAVPATLVAVPEKSIAVLPFVDMSEKHDQEYLSDGLSEELIDRLAHNADLKVIARTSSFAFKGKNEDMRTIAAKLGVANVLEGSVRKAGRELRITAQLIRASDGVHLWSESYERKLNDIFKLQDDISATVANALHVALTTRSQSKAEVTPAGVLADEAAAEAYTLVLRGNYFKERGTGQDYEQAIALFKQATTIKPDYALAWARLGAAYYSNGQLAEARKALERALHIDPNVIWAHYTLAEIYNYTDWNWAAAQSEIDRMRQAEPNDAFLLPDAMSDLLETFGRLDEAIAIKRRIYDRNPLSRKVTGDLAGLYFHARQFEESLALARQFLELNPHANGLQGLVSIDLLYLHRPVEALAAIKSETYEPARLTESSMIYWAMGRKEDSDASLGALSSKYGKVEPYMIVSAHAYRGERDAAFVWLDRAYKQRDGSLTMLKVDPVLASLRGDPRYRELLGKMKLPET